MVRDRTASAALVTEGAAALTAFSVKLLADTGFRVFTAGRTEFNDAESLASEESGTPRSQCERIHGRGYGIETLVLSSLWRPALTRESVAAEVHDIVAYLQAAKEATGRYPRYVIVVTPRRESILAAAGCAAIKTLAGYLTRHLLNEDVRINVCSCSMTHEGALRAAEVIFTLCSGLLDEMRGQELVITDF